MFINGGSVADRVVGVLVALHEVVVNLLDGVLPRVPGSLRSETVVQWLDSAGCLSLAKNGSISQIS